MKIRKENLMNKKASMSYTQILILTISIFATAYLMYSVTEVSAQEDDEELDDFEKLKEQIYSELYGDYSQTVETSVHSLERSAAGYACCEKTNDGNYCQYVSGEQCNLSFNSVQSECKYSDFCRLGCCYSSTTGWCNENTPEKNCKESGGIWDNDAYCNIPQCQRGCCVLGRNAMWTTEQNCQSEAGFLGLEKDFRADVDSEIECIYLTERDDEGACVYGDSCKFITRESCDNSGGDFYKNIFCSDSALETECTAHDHKACSEDSQDQSVYWYDSCGNREEVAEECSIFAGTICGLVEGDYACKSIDCEVDGKTRKNGESWCEYDGTIGEGRDVVGSRHIKHICFIGEERIEPCQDYRNQICVQTDTELPNGGIFSEAACRINNWRSCFEYNTVETPDRIADLQCADGTTNCFSSQRTMAEKCEENPDCFVKTIDIDTYDGDPSFKFDFCVPNYPPGFDLTNEESAKNAELVCSMASQKCTMIYQKSWSGKWKCKVNCDCKTMEFTEKMNDFCTSLGDCGAYVNYIGKDTDDGYSVSRAPRLSDILLNKFKQYATPKPSQKPAEPGNLSFLGGLGLPSEVDYDEDGEVISVGTGLGMYGVGFLLSGLGVEITLPGYLVTISGLEISPAFGNSLMAAGAALAISAIYTKAFGLQGDASMIMTILGIGAAVFLVVAGKTLSWALIQTLGVVGLIIAVVLKLLGIGKTKKKIVEFKCHPWQPPTGGDDCDKCNGDIFKPCSKYRCKSLGQTCELINPGTEHEMCFNNAPDDVTSPRIGPLLGTITEDYQYVDSKGNNYVDGFEILDLNKDCIPEFTPVLFGIETDKPAQCKIGTSPMQMYDEMPDYFGGSNLYLKNHTTFLNIPSPEAFKNQYNLTEEQIKELGEANFYVKCKSVNGVENVAAYTIRSCVKPGPDLTAPRITATSPANGAFIKYGATEQDLRVFVNEPASCKWDFNEKGYENMENNFSCQTDIEDYSLYGWPCDTKLTNLDTNNRFYIKCQDLSENKNPMRQSYIYTLTASASELNIDKIYPVKDIVAGFEPVTVNLEAFTSGGAEQGVSECFFRFTDSSYIRFYDTFSNQHQQVFSSMTRGNYKIDVRCEDVAGNIAENFTEFSVKIDTTPPVITRAYYDGSLIIMTNEPAECAYSKTNSKCNFKIGDEENATLMTGDEKEHSADWDTESTYYIKCKDRFDREPGKCSIIVRPYDII